jgi:phage repressor protein C with HTH and peptisase S24 domain
MKGKELKRIIENSDKSIEEIVNSTGIPERTLYNQFEKEEVPEKYISKLQAANVLPKIANPARMVPYYDVDATAGNVTIFNEDKTEYVKQYLSVPAFSDCDMFISISGNSMYPKYCSGELVAIKKINDLEVVAYGEAYIIVTKEQRFLKYVTKGSAPDKWTLKSENEADFQDFEIPIKKVLHLYIVKGKITKNII